MLKPKAYTVTQVNQYLKKILDTDVLLRSIWIEGEISNYKISGGHAYFSLKDNASVLDAVLFSSVLNTVRFPLRNGQKVLAMGTVSIYPPQGRYQLRVVRIQPLGAGELQLAFEAQKEKLKALGYFDEAHKKPLPAYAMTVGIVTAETGAALQDILNIARRRNPFVQLILSPTPVQGEKAAVSIAKAIRRMDAEGPDVMIVGRGGGSAEDLWAFNEEAVAEAIFQANTPIISAVGHEIDFTIADFVSDKRAPTPSAAAELAVFDYQDFLIKTANYEEDLTFAERQHLRETRRRIEAASLQFSLVSPAGRITSMRDKLTGFSSAAGQIMEFRMRTARSRLSAMAQQLSDASPLRKISGGYAYIQDEKGKAVRSIRDIETGDLLTLYFSEGSLRAGVQDKEFYKDGMAAH